MCSLFFYLSVGTSEFMLGNVIFFENIDISKDNVYNSLVLPSDVLAEPTKQYLEIILGVCVLSQE